MKLNLVSVSDKARRMVYSYCYLRGDIEVEGKNQLELGTSTPLGLPFLIVGSYLYKITFRCPILEVYSEEFDTFDFIDFKRLMLDLAIADEQGCIRYSKLEIFKDESESESVFLDDKEREDRIELLDYPIFTFVLEKDLPTSCLKAGVHYKIREGVDFGVNSGMFMSSYEIDAFKAKMGEIYPDKSTIWKYGELKHCYEILNREIFGETRK